MKRRLGLVLAVSVTASFPALVALSPAAAGTRHHGHHRRGHHTRHKKHKRRRHHAPTPHTSGGGTSASGSTPPPSGSGSPSTSGSGSTPPPTVLSHLQITEREFSIVPSRAAVAGGTVAVELDNRGQDPHDLLIQRVDGSGIQFDFGPAQPGSITSRKLNLGAGQWELLCTLPGHYALGMHALITVTG